MSYSENRRRGDLAKVLRAVLLLVLGGKCVECGGTLLSVLEVDHPEGRAWSPRSLNSYYRALRYCDEHAAGVPLQVLCRRCNAVDGALRGNNHIPDPPVYPVTQSGAP